MNIESPESSSGGRQQRQLADAAASVLEPTGASNAPQAVDKLLAVYDSLLDRYMPSMILIDASRRVVDTFCGADQFLRFSARRPSEDVLDLLIDPLRGPVREAFLSCCSTGQSVVSRPQWVHLAADPSPGGLVDWVLSANRPAPAGDQLLPTGTAAAHRSDGSLLCPIQVRVTPVTQRHDDALYFSLAFETVATVEPPAPHRRDLPSDWPSQYALSPYRQQTVCETRPGCACVQSQNCSSGVTHSDLNGRYVLANQRFCEMVGYTTEMLADLTFSDLTHPDDLPHELALRQQLLAGDIENYHLEKRYLHQSGREAWASLCVSLERDFSGNAVGYRAQVEDISPQKELENELRQAIRQRDQFLAMLSHELRNPLGAILNSCAVLERRKSANKNLQAAISVVSRQSRQMAELLDDLLDVSRITTGKIKLEKSPLLLAAVVDEAIESQQSLAAARGQRLAVTFCDEPLHIFGDRSRLVQVVVNLLNNAIKYTGEGGTISVSLDKHGKHGRIRVKDTGVGLEQRQIESLFEMFAQQDATLDRSGGGMGLGLHLVRKLVDFHSGRVYGISQGLGHGSEFTVELPLSTRQPPKPGVPRRASGSLSPSTDAASMRSPQHAGGQRSHGSNKPSGKPPRAVSKRIVVVEDIEDARRMLVALLEADDHQVAAAADGQAGLELILATRPDLAIVDIGLPKLDGYEVARRVRQQLARGDLRLVALTGYGQESDHAEVMRAGFDAHLVKPLNPSRLEKILADD